jgi:hypothetical protein
MNLNQMLETSRMHDEHKHDYTAAPANITFNPEANMLIKELNLLFGETSTQPLEPTEWAWGQMFQKLGPAVFGKGSNKVLPRDYLLSIDKDLLAESMNRHIQKLNNGKWLVRAYDNHARGVLSSNYSIVQNTLLLEKFITVAKEQSTPDLQLVRPFVNADSLYLKTVWKDVNPNGNGSYGLGVMIGNGEIGNSKLYFKPLIQRHSCTNSIVIDDENGMDIRHVGDADYHVYRMNRVLINVFKLSADWLNKLMEADHTPVDNFADVLDRMAKDNGWTDEVKTTVALGTEGKETLGGLIAGVSYAAHAAVSDPDEQIRMETLAGSFLKRVPQYVEV